MSKGTSSTNKFIPIHEEIFANATHYQHSTALSFGPSTLSFSEFDLFSTALAEKLISQGISGGSVVGIYLTPSIELALSIIAVLKSGAAYVPLSPSFPEERLKYILNDAGAGILLTDNSFPYRTPGFQVPLMIPDWAALKSAEKRNMQPLPVVGSSDLAYILYTSGSTGNPKGVMIEHGNLSYYVNWFCSHLLPETKLGLPLTSSFIFAAAVSQFYSTLLSGRTLHILDPLMIRQPARLLEWFRSHPGYGLYCVPTLWSEILNYIDGCGDSGTEAVSLSCVYLSGEAVSNELISRTFKRLPDLQLWNLYGPTEATANITAGRLFPGQPSHIGEALSGTRIFIVDEDLKPVGPGQTGELLASGNGIARGYLNLAELSGKIFFNARIDGEDSLRLYRSGDLVKEDEQGRLLYVGRKDQQVKIRGYRIELPEIEHTIASLPEIKHAVVKVISSGEDSKRLAAYVVFKPGLALGVDELRKILHGRIPDFMVPEVFVLLDRMPLLPNGKIDRKSLPLPGIQRPALGYPPVSPKNEEEKIMVRIWEEVLGLEGIGTGDNFFDLGGNSLRANSIILELGVRTGHEIPIKSIFESPTPSTLLSSLHGLGAALESQTENTGPALTTVEAHIPTGISTADFTVEMSENQKALWFIQQMETDLSAYNIFYCLQMEGDLDTDRLGKALEAVIQRHLASSVFYKPEFNTPLLQKITIEDSSSPGLWNEALEHARNAAAQPFSLGKEAPCRFAIYTIARGLNLFTITIHHIVFDGFSFGVFLRDLSGFYDSTGKPGSGIPALTASYRDFYLAEKMYLSSSRYESDRQYWQKQLHGAPTYLEIPTDYIRPDMPTRTGGQVRRMLPSRIRSRLKSLSDRNGTSMFMACLSAFSVLLYRHTGRNDFILGTPVVNRHKKLFLDLIGYFVNNMLFRANIGVEASFRELMGIVRDTVLEGLFHSAFPFSRMSEVLKSERIPGINPFFQIMFAYHEADWTFNTAESISGKAWEEFFGKSKFDLFAEIFDDSHEAEVVFTYSADLYRQQTIEFLLDHFIRILEVVSESPETRVNDISLLSKKEYELSVHEWNRTSRLIDFDGNLSELIRVQAGISPDRPALVSRSESITYAEMDAKTDIIAANLIRAGILRGEPVGLHLENSPVMVMCIIAIFRAGGVYVPLDPYYPEERLRYVIEKTNIRYLIVDEDYQVKGKPLSGSLLSAGDLLAGSGSAESPRTQDMYVKGSLAYIMFTSGSTGNPKGVMIGHESLLNFMVWMKSELGVSDKDTYLSTTSINFDISLLEIFTPLISGATLVLEKRSELQAPEKVESLLNQMKINTVQFVPSGLKALCDAGVLKRARYLEHVISGGEKLSRNLQEQIFRDFNGDLINLYGPTEATIYMGYWRCERNSNLRMVPIGFPIMNSTFYILNENFDPQAIGITGEIYIGGDVLAYGYYGDSEQTVSRFIPNPFTGNNGDRIYKTGDLGRYRCDGSIEFLGRTDHQIKVRGFRIELGEVESNILKFSGIKRAVVHAQEQGEEDIRLTAFIVPETKAVIRENELRDFLKLHLPAYMIPGNFMIAPSIPTLPNGKTDLKALLNLRPQVPKIPETQYNKLNETEIALTAIWKIILDHEAFNVKDNFFEVGGHSLLLVKMKDLISEKMGADVSIVDLFHYPSVRSLASFLRKETQDENSSDLARRIAGRNKNIRKQMARRNLPDNQ